MVGYLITRGLGNLADTQDVKYLMTGGLVTTAPVVRVLNLMPWRVV